MALSEHSYIRKNAVEPLERRAHPRYPLSPRTSFEVRFQPSGCEARPAAAVDISRGGVRLTLDEELEVGTECYLRFPEDDRFRPKTVAGTVRRLDLDTHGYLAAVEFAEPLASLRLELERYPEPTGTALGY